MRKKKKCLYMLIDVSRTALKHPTNISVNSLFFFVGVVVIIIWESQKRWARLFSAQVFDVLW
jgi:hypothetical protein